MKSRRKSQASTSRSRPAGSGRNMRPAKPAGEARSGQGRSDVAPGPAPAEAQGHRKDPVAEEEPTVVRSAPSGAAKKLSTHGGVEEDWGAQRTQESATIYGSRVVEYLREYEEASKTLWRLREELRETRLKTNVSSGDTRSRLSKAIKHLKAEINRLEGWKLLVLQNSGPFREKLENDDRFRAMEEEKNRRLRGLQPVCQTDEMEETAAEDPPCPSDGLQQHQQASYSGIPAAQVALPSSSSSAGEEEDEDGGQGGRLMAQIRLLESPVHLQNFSFGDDLGPEEEVTRKGKKNSAKKISAKEEVKLVFVPHPVHPEPASGLARCASPAAHPSPGSAVDLVQGSGESTRVTSVMVKDAVPACGSKDNVARASANRPNIKGGSAAGVPCDSSSAQVRPLVGGGSGLTLEVVASAPVALGAVVTAATAQQNERVVGARCPGSPKKKDMESGADYPSKRANESTNKTGDRAVSKQMAQSGQFSKGSVADPMEIAQSPVLEDAEAKSSAVVAGPASACVDVGSAVVGDEDMAGGVDDVIVGGGSVGTVEAGPSAPPVATAQVRSYASVAAGAAGVSSPPPDPWDGVLQRRLLEALRKGERTINVEGREVDLSFWIDRHGLAAFREERGGETVWSLPTAGPGGARRNVVRLCWRSSEACPPRAKVVELLLKMGFRAVDIFALIHPYGTPTFDVSFVRPEGLELFWSNYELVKDEPGWRDFAVQALSRQSAVKKVTVLTCNESLSCLDIMTWLSRYGEVVACPKKNLDEYGIWSGAWTFMVKLKRSGGTVTHIPSSAFLGRDRILIFYQGQPKLCHRCGDPTHFSANCRVQKCALCGGIGHLAATCGEIRCHLCGDLGHPFSRCPRSIANAVAGPVGESRKVAPTVEGEGRGEGAEGPGKKSKNKSPSKVRRLESRRRNRECEEPQVAGVNHSPVPETSATAEALREQDLDEEVRRLEREEEATSSSSSHYESMDEDNRRWLEEKRRKGIKKKKRKERKASPTLDQMPKEGQTGSPLIGLSNRFHALKDISPSEGEAEDRDLGEVEEESAGGAESPSPEDVRSSEGETGPESGDEDDESNGEAVKGGMDMSVSLKRRGSSSSDCDRKGGGKKKAV